ncbi:MAG TPA: urease accessory protein UreD [Rhodopila sp.]|uniref:urease accessory protein UreD n=1 Tax=Rhodopila sp. TaxID=2480087 RepID=UPI002BB4BAAC|nr:urease accessory protein UreD [Rhodopila sp.]HVY17930.1 urease accessory protein UreD [Rhodopila sp.]
MLIADPPPPVHQRAVGELRLAVKRNDQETVLDTLRQAGCLKARFPRRLVPGWFDAVMLNTGGGVAGGDRLDVAIDLAAGTRATIAAQAAERFYRVLSMDQPARVRTHLTVARGACLEWLPQETILFDRSALDRSLAIDLAADASFLGVETLVFGRTAMGEAVRQGHLRDRIRIRRDGALVLNDAIRLDGPVHDLLARPSIANAARSLATLVFVAPDAAACVDAVRGALADAEAGVSAWNGLLVARVLGPDGAAVRRSVAAALAVLRGSRPLPRVWLC